MEKSISPERAAIGYTEQGKIFACDKNYEKALEHYREAMKYAQRCQHADLFFMNTSLCIMEALELMGDYDSVIRYCEEFEAHYETLAELPEELITQRAQNLERMGICLLKSERAEEAADCFEFAIALKPTDKLPISQTLLDWIKRGYTIDCKKIVDIQKKSGFYIVTREEIRRDWAISL